VKWTAAAAAMVLAAAPVLVAWEARYADGPPPGFTGDFGEPTCGTCHMDAPVVPDAPELALTGIPALYEPGRAYRITLAVYNERMGVGGFQLSARTTAGTQAGTWRAVDARARIVRDSAAGVAYAIHTIEGTALVSPDSARWTLEWTAPESAGDSVVFSAVANAANGDDSHFGDEIYTRRAVSARRPTP
jgi:hypothetical protein